MPANQRQITASVPATARIIYDAADRLAAGSDELEALRPVVAELSRRAREGTANLPLVDAVAWLDAAAKVCRVLGRTGPAARLDEARDALLDDAIVPSSRFYDWLPFDRLEADAAKAAAVTRIEIPGLRELVQELRSQRAQVQDVRVTSMPTRATRRVVKRDEQGMIQETTDVSQDVA